MYENSHSTKTFNEMQIGWKFDNSYSRLSDIMLTKLSPVPVKIPKLIILNQNLCSEIGLDFSKLDDEKIAEIFAGNILPSGSEPIAQAYAGHQFGHFTMLGDGRAIVIGEHVTPNKKRYDIQFKGSGITPYSRGGDGRAALGPMLREYIISEAMNSLNIPTTRSLAVVSTGENVIRETPLEGAILTRIASSHLRVGTFQYVAMRGDLKILESLVKYSINRHFPELIDDKNIGLSFLEIVIKKQIELINHWMRVGFIHGVMNTDNMTISGETIDYGPCAFMDTYKPETVFSSIDQNGRYSYVNQPAIAHWNLVRFAETLLPLINKKQSEAVKMAEEILNKFPTMYKLSWLEMMKKKLGLFGSFDEDEKLIKDLLEWMEKNKADFTNTFYSLMTKEYLKNKDKLFIAWQLRWKKRLEKNNKPIKDSLDLMKVNNPSIIPRNHKVEEILDSACNKNDLEPLNNLLKVFKKIYSSDANISQYQSPPKEVNHFYQTFCGT